MKKSNVLTCKPTPKVVLNESGIQAIEDEIQELLDKINEHAKDVDNPNASNDISGFMTTLREKRALLANYEIVKEEKQSDVVGINDSVELLIEPDGEESWSGCYKIVSVPSYDFFKEITLESDMGKMILGHKDGDECSGPINGKNHKITILGITKAIPIVEDHGASYTKK